MKKIYNLELKIFTSSIPKINNIIEEIPIDKINIIMSKVDTTISDNKASKKIIFGIDDICNFITNSVETTLTHYTNLKELTK